MEETCRQILADLLRLDSGDIKESSSRDNLTGWDSLEHIKLALALEVEFDVILDVDEIESMRTFGDILRVMREKL